MKGAKYIAVTMGDPAGIGAEIIVKSWRRRQQGEKIPDFYVIGNQEVLAQTAQDLSIPLSVTSCSLPPDNLDGQEGGIFVHDLALLEANKAGVASVANQKAVIASLQIAAQAAQESLVTAIVTAPVHKPSLYQAGFSFPGQTEFFAASAGSVPPIMLLGNSRLRMVPLTIHLPLREVAQNISQNAIIDAVLIFHRALQQDFAVSQPRIALAGLNPHAGDGGMIGREEIEVIAPAVAQLQKQTLDVTGPWPIDSLFSTKRHMLYDGLICMYHDQAMLALKLLDSQNAYNMTLGLPFIRVSPAHGVAFDIAGQGCADCDGMIAALQKAALCAGNRARYDLSD